MRKKSMAACAILMFLTLGAMFGPNMAKAALVPPAHPLFDGDAVHEIHLTFPQADWWDQLTANFEGLEDPLYLEAAFDWGDFHLDRIGVRFKGNSSYTSYPGIKKSFKLDIDEYVDGQEIFGLDKINLNNGFMDPSLIREKSCYELCQAVGLPTERTNFAALYINGAYWGLYTLIEQFDKEFIESRFGAGEDGNLWKGDPHGEMKYVDANQASYYTSYELKSNEEANDWSGLIEMLDVLNNTPIAGLADALHNVMDVNSALAMLAIDNFTVNLDSYIGRCSNYYFYHRERDNRFVFAKWDVNESWGVFDSWHLGETAMIELDPFWVSSSRGQIRPLATQLYQVSAYRDIYLGHMKKLMAGAAQPDTLVARMKALQDLIRPYALADTNKMFTNAQFEASMSTNTYQGARLIPGLEPFIRARDAWLRTEIGTWTPVNGLVINELMAKNSTAITDEQGDHEDWIEIVNTGDAPINLNGLGLVDHMDGSQAFAFPDMVLAPGEYLVVWADEETGEGDLHAPFKLDADGEDIYLINEGVIIDQVTFPKLGADVTWGRWPDKTGAWQMLSAASPGAPNQNPQAPEDIVLFINEFMADNDLGITDETGAHEDWLEIYNPGPDAVAMAGLFLTDDLGATTKWAFPELTLGAGDFLLVWCDSDEEDGPLHTNFKLGADGEEIGLFGRLTAGNQAIDSLAFGAQLTDVSQGRYVDGTDNWGPTAPATPGAANSPHNLPPGIADTLQTPASPGPAEPVWVTATVVDDSALTSVTLTYDTGQGPQAIAMSDDGAHHDNAANDNIYGALIPAAPQGVVVKYYLTAIDDLGVGTSDPADAPSSTFTYMASYARPALYINEFLADNDTCLEDPENPGDFDDWIEIHNAGPTAIDLGGMYLTDDLSDPTQWQVPPGVTVPANGFILFWADKDEEQGDTHANFKLGASGEEIGLFDTDANGNIAIDTLAFEEQATDVSLGRCPDGADNWQPYDQATPEETNGPCQDAPDDQTPEVQANASTTGNSSDGGGGGSCFITSLW